MLPFEKKSRTWRFLSIPSALLRGKRMDLRITPTYLLCERFACRGHVATLAKYHISERTSVHMHMRAPRLTRFRLPPISYSSYALVNSPSCRSYCPDCYARVHQPVSAYLSRTSLKLDVIFHRILVADNVSRSPDYL